MKTPTRTRTSKPAGFPRISDSELLVMRVLWAQSSSTANAVVEALASRMDWKPRTVQTLLRRLVDKKAVRFEKRGREYVFHPVVDEKEYTHRASLKFLDRFFGGAIAPFLACFLEREKLTPEQVAELRRLLSETKP